MFVCFSCKSLGWCGNLFWKPGFICLVVLPSSVQSMVPPLVPTIVFTTISRQLSCFISCVWRTDSIILSMWNWRHLLPCLFFKAYLAIHKLNVGLIYEPLLYNYFNFSHSWIPFLPANSCPYFLAKKKKNKVISF